MNLFTLFRDVNTMEQALVYLQDKSVLNKQHVCQNGHAMVLQLSGNNYRWRCNKRSCRRRQQIGLRVGSWLEGCNLPLENVVWFIYCWCKRYTSAKFCMKELIMSSSTITAWKNNIREVCAKSLLLSPMEIGGEGLTVEVHESCFGRKTSRGGCCSPQQWVFGGVCRETKQVFLYAVPEPTAETLLEAVARSVRPGSTIVSDLWKSYGGSDLLPHHFTLLTINKSQMVFANPMTGNEAETMWSTNKRSNKRPKRVRSDNTQHRGQDSYLCEYLWRKRHENVDLVDQIYKDIASVYPPKE